VQDHPIHRGLVQRDVARDLFFYLGQYESL
jgi:hypothetical protein